MDQTTSHFPKGPKLVFLYLIERSDNIYVSLIGFAYESMIIYYTHTIIQFDNLSDFLHIWEAISAINWGGFEPQNC